MTKTNTDDRAMLNAYGYIDRRKQSTLKPEDRLRLIPAALMGDESCTGCAATACSCRRTSTLSSRRPETLRQVKTWESVRQSYESDGFCERCSVSAAYGHQIGFTQVSPVCADCHGTRPTWRRAGDEAMKWAGVTLEVCGRPQIAA